MLVVKLGPNPPRHAKNDRASTNFRTPLYTRWKAKF